MGTNQQTLEADDEFVPCRDCSQPFPEEDAAPGSLARGHGSASQVNTFDEDPQAFAVLRRIARYGERRQRIEFGPLKVAASMSGGVGMHVQLLDGAFDAAGGVAAAVAAGVNGVAAAVSGAISAGVSGAVSVGAEAKASLAGAVGGAISGSVGGVSF